jgi:Fe2+ or Zn2+ uptake regulation protein
MDAKKEALGEAFRRSGRRLTHQRRLILEVLESGVGHLDAEGLHDRVKARDTRISLATIYRTLAALKGLGLVEENRLGEEHGHYEAVRSGPHFHFTCRACGAVVEFDAPEIVRLSGRLRRKAGLRVDRVQLALSGRCARCIRAGNGR